MKLIIFTHASETFMPCLSSVASMFLEKCLIAHVDIEYVSCQSEQGKVTEISDTLQVRCDVWAYTM